MRKFSRITKSLLLTALLGACGESMNPADEIGSSGPRAEVYTGVLEIAVVDHLDSAYHIVTLRTAEGDTLRLQLREDQLEGFRGGDAVSVLGVRGGDAIDLTAGGTLFPATGGEFGTRKSALVQSGPRSTAVVLFNFKNDTTQPLSKAQAQSAVFSAPDSMNAYYKELSSSAISLTGITDKINGDAFGYFTIDSDNTDCSNPFIWTDKVDALAQAQGLQLAQYSNVIYISPDAASCGWAGIGYMPGRKSIIKASMIKDYPKVMTHEFGHNMDRVF
jgi:hypothetical protein